ncbi:MAG: cupin domain-containing protein [Planctomycetes bacterium]|nr:cupin domain-containing protein [Planctomycetota bacterium]MCB9904365.1 cupin domain-containing protein [Planctomycetota bacterium]
MNAIDLHDTYLVLQPDNRVESVLIDEHFWPDLMSGAPRTAGAQLVAETKGRLCAMMEMKGNWGAWEMHPAGDEVLVLLSGHLRLKLELPEGEQVVDFPAGHCCVVPAGVWHTADVLEPGTLLGMTAGSGTQHRAR